MIELARLDIADPPDVWERLGFAVGADGVARVGATAVRLGAATGRGITGWALRGADGQGAVDGIATEWSAPPASAPGEHPNGAIALDHVVVATPDLDRTLAALEAAGLELRRVRDAGGEPPVRQAFLRLGEVVLEVVGRAGERGDGAARLWGLVAVVDDLDAVAAALGDRLGAVHDAVQPGRRIATVRRAAGSGTALALMSKEIQ